MTETTIRVACLGPYSETWERPTGEEVREILRRAGLSGAQAAKLVGVSDSRQVRRWTGDNAPISYSAWAILCDFAGIEKIWIERQT
ncbi:helix-turn-helix domain-containing protein [Caballeronia humi]|uniref:Uncharacterized protein n=1 Tax=Caballeronia humi TaxID=326474 RepID=A0A158J0N6_9BURK|nr:helix-turn-helix transcriptional regulator [Caballeronia humi]SAL62427.1 hypothetical protein AWB65_05735 [Caballeronia humi]